MGRRAHRYQRRPTAQIFKNDARRQKERLQRPLTLVNKVNKVTSTPEPVDKVYEVNFAPEHWDRYTFLLFDDDEESEVA